MDIDKINWEKLKFSKVIPIGDVKGYIMSTHVDNENEMFTLDHLKKAVQFNKTHPWMNNNHDPSRVPVGRIIKSDIQKTDDGNYKLWVETEIFDIKTMGDIVII